MYKTKQIFAEYDGEITREEFRHFQPVSALNLNSVNKRTTFKIDYGDNFSKSNFQFFIAGEYKHASDNKNYGKDANVKLVDNFVAHLFSHIEVKKHNKLIDEVEFPGIASTVIGSVTFGGGEIANAGVKNSGFVSRFKGGGQFNAVGKLGDLGLGFFNDVNVPIYKGGFEITFTRSSDDEVLYRWATIKDNAEVAGSTPSVGKVEITEFYLRVPIVEYEESTKVQLVDNLIKTPYTFQFKTIQCIQQKNVSGRTLNFDITNIYRNINSPIFGFVVFQNERISNQLKDNSLFDNSKVKNIWFEVNGKRYPEESLDLDWDNEKYSLAYEMFHNYRNRFSKNKEPFPFYNPEAFKNKKSIYCIDLSRQPINTSNSKSNIILHVDFLNSINAPTNTSEGTICYVVIVSSAMFTYDITNNIIKEEL